MTRTIQSNLGLYKFRNVMSETDSTLTESLDIHLEDEYLGSVDGECDLENVEECDLLELADLLIQANNI